MTVILGVNLSDRIYLAGDSRVSNIIKYKDGTETIAFNHDNMQKVETLEKSGGIVVASAGDAAFANVILNSLQEQRFYGKGIRVLRESVENWLRSYADEYFKNGYTSATFLFAGADKQNKKRIIGHDILPMIKSYGGKEDGNSGSIKQVIVDGLQSKGEGVPNPTPELPISDTLLFSVRVSMQGVHITDTKWGEFLIYGPQGLVKEDVPLRVIGQLEFDNRAGDFNHDIPLIIGLLQTLAKEKELDTVGGCVIAMAAHHDMKTYVLDGNVSSINLTTGVKSVINSFKIIGNDFYRRDEKGTLYKLVPVSKYLEKRRSRQGQKLLI